MSDDRKTVEENHRLCDEKIKNHDFDVFISYNHEDRGSVLAIAKLLKDNGIAPWLDEWDLQPGLPWQPTLYQRIKTVKSAAIFVGQAGMGSFHEKEMYAFEREFEKRGLPVIPVLLPDIEGETAIPSFLEEMHWVDFRKKDPDPLKKLIKGITGQYPARVYRPGVLVASLGESPVVIPSVYRLLTEREGLTIKKIEIVCPTGEEVKVARELIESVWLEKLALSDRPELHYTEMQPEDADSWQNSCLFLHTLYDLLYNYQKEETVYLSLAGGRKSMAALMAWVAPFFSCIQKLYHIVDTDDEQFKTAYEIRGRPGEQVRLMNPALNRLALIEIPFERGQQLSDQLSSRLYSPRSNDYEIAEARIAGQAILQGEKLQNICVTELAIKQFRELCKRDSFYAQEVRNGLLEMSKRATLQPYQTDQASETWKKKVLHYFKDLSVPIRPVFYTLPDDISTSPEAQVEQVIICSLEEALGPDDYRTLKEVKKSPDFRQRFSPIDVLPPVPTPADSILIVPLGTAPMVATQLYTLLTEQEKRTIHEVVLIYPQKSQAIGNSMRIVVDALKEEYGFNHTKCVPIPNLGDISSEADCRTYQEHLETEIERVKLHYPDYKIDLALSGGRKGMTAMTIFSARKHDIPYAFHTLVMNKDINELIEKETTITELNSPRLSQKDRNDRLFLRRYRDEGDNSYAHFTLFRVPVFMGNGW